MSATPQTWLARNAARLAVYILLALLAAGAFWQVKRWRDDAKSNAEAVNTRDAIADSTGNIAQDLGTATQDQDQVEAQVQALPRETTTRIQRARNENPSVDRYLSEPIPGELRNIAKARRAARDRLGAPTPGREATEPGAKPGQ